jgi:hypothetical protein
MEELRRIAAAVNQRQAELTAAGVDFRVRAARRLTVYGIRYELQLGVFPLTGFDDFAWVGFYSPWMGSTRPVDDVEAKVNRVLDSYAAGEIPPGPGFE